MKFNINEIPFSRYGSYLAFSHPQDGTKEYEKQIALRVLYGAFVGQHTYPVMLMTKNWMNLVWSWIYTFNGLDIAGARPELAYAQ